MRKVTIKGLLAHKLRLALTALAIVLGVTFISGTFVLTDTLQNTFNTLFGSIYAKVDFQVRGVAQLGTGAGATRNELPESLLATIRRVPGVEAADGQVTGYAQFVARDGKAIATGGGAPTLGVAYDPEQKISPLHLIAGGPPVAPDDVVMDAGTAQKYHFAVGQQVRILSAGPPRTFTITGITQFGTANNLAGATLAAFTLPTAQAIAQETGKVDDINVVTAPGASKAAVQRAIAAVLPPGVQVVTGQTVVNESTSSISQALSFFSTALLVFAFISLFVGAFTIYNTFSIIVGQRTRELALLRIVGASRRQVFGSVLGEAAITGLVSSVIGLGLGVLAALGLQALLGGFGVTLPPGSLVFEPRTVLVGLVVGIGVTVVSAIGPARGAVRIPPVVALDDRQSVAGASLRRRFTWGSVLALAGAVLLGLGLAQPAHPARRHRRGLPVHRGRHAVPGDRAPAVQRDRASAAPAARRGRQARPGELHAQPEADRADGSGPHGRPGPGLRDGRVRRIAVQIGDEQRGPGDQRRPDRDGHRVRPAQQLGAGHRVGRARRHRHHRLLRRAVRVPELADQAHRGLHGPPGRYGDPADDRGHPGRPEPG